MRTVRVAPPSFPEAPTDAPLEVREDARWQVLCGDAGHWRAGIYSPPETDAAACTELERHDCPELFVLLSGRLVLVLFQNGAVREPALQPGRPVLVTVPHNGFCPDGPHTGRALVVERDAFGTLYRSAAEWAAARDG